MVTNIKKILIANRGEIALRVIRTAHEMGIATVAIYAPTDRQAQFVEMADEAYALSGDTYRDTYLNEDAILDIIKRSGTDAVHPGYGFLSEVASFAKKVNDAGVIWIGPRPEALIDLGDKITARRVAVRAKVPPVPGISEPVKDIRELLTFAQTHGYPVMMKRTDGGGGRGITVVHNDDELRGFYMNHDALQGGDLDEYFIERFIDKARHVETQCGRDAHGNFTVYSTRDCSVQRRNQKLVEEAPAPFLTDDEKDQLYRYSRNLFEAVDYVGLGTCEYMVTSQHKVYFLEVNPRLQVEHTVSEEVSGLDLVREQLNIADGGELIKDPEPRGHSFELRITSEDPATNLTPSSGTLTKIKWPSGPGIRVDFGVEVGDNISPKFDSMMGKLIITAQSRETAVARVRRALKELCIEGVPTPAKLFEQIFNDPEFTAENHSFDVSTKWMERKYLNRVPAASLGGQPASLVSGKSADESENKQPAMESFIIEVDNKRVKLTIPQDIVDNLTGSARVRSVSRASQPLRGRSLRGSTHKSEEQKQIPGVIAAPMQAVITRVNVAEGQQVAKGDLLVVLESMKMENYVYAPAAGTVTGIFVGPGDGVESGAKLVTIDLAGGKSEGKSAESSEDKGADKEKSETSSENATSSEKSSEKSQGEQK